MPSPGRCSPGYSLGWAGGMGSRRGWLGRRNVAESVPEAISPAVIARLPAKLALGLGVRRAADLGHHGDADVAGCQAAEPDRNAPRWLGAERAGEFRQPDGDGCRLVVDDVVDAWCAVLDSGDGRGRRVVDVDERPDATAVADDRELALAHEVGEVTVEGEAGAWSVEVGVAKDNPFHALGSQDGVFEVADRLQRLALVRRRVRVEDRKSTRLNS